MNPTPDASTPLLGDVPASSPAGRKHWIAGRLTEGDVEHGEYFWAGGRRFLRLGASTNSEVDAEGKTVQAFAVVPEDPIDRIEGDPEFMAD